MLLSALEEAVGNAAALTALQSFDYKDGTFAEAVNKILVDKPFKGESVKEYSLNLRSLGYICAPSNVVYLLFNYDL